MLNLDRTFLDQLTKRFSLPDEELVSWRVFDLIQDQTYEVLIRTTGSPSELANFVIGICRGTLDLLSSRRLMDIQGYQHTRDQALEERLH